MAYSDLTTILRDREHRERDSIDVASAVILLPNWSFGVSDGSGEEVRGSEGSAKAESLRERP
jgi:hypothetical protein